ncbi:MAG: transporter [Flavobacteriaceae bacterium]
MLPLAISAQYPDVINGSRPGLAVSGYAVERNVIQAETGIFFEQRDRPLLNYESDLVGLDVSLRYGLLFERLEINYEGTFQNQHITNLTFSDENNLTDFGRNRIGLKFLVYDRYKDPERNKPNLYSWRANNVFQLKNLIPSVSVYGGATFTLGDNPFYVGDPTITYRGMVATQSRLTPRFVLISNIAYDRITSDDPELSYLVSVSYAFRNPKWSAVVENQGIKSDRYADALLRAGVAHLFSEDFQADINLGASFKNTPSRIFVTMGASYRFDFHKDKLIPIDEQDPDGNGGEIQKNAMRKKSKKNKGGKGAEDVDLGPTKKQLRKLRKDEKRKKKNKKKEDNGEIEF